MTSKNTSFKITHCPAGFALLCLSLTLFLFIGSVLYAWLDPAGFKVNRVSKKYRVFYKKAQI
ncbi:MAG: hypothetical protein ACU83O_11925, partial [Gammaproteobacteria bacterium]